MYQTSQLLRCSILLSSLLAVSTAQGEDNDLRFGVHLGVESFRWEEKDPQDPGRQLLVEEGSRLSGSLSLDNLTQPKRGMIYSALWRPYYGEVGYDGETQDGVPVKTDTSYSGSLLEGRIGHRFPVAAEKYGVDVMGGLGMESWTRKIQDSRLPNGDPVSGYTEEYRTLYLKTGAGLAYLASADWFGRLEAGLRLPLEITEEIGAYGATVYPEEQPSFYAVGEITRFSVLKQGIGLTAYYEAYRFGLSPYDQEAGVRQPKSLMDVWGLQLGVYF